MEKYHVASGSYLVSPSKPLLLQAFLGTCVGVAAYDAEAKVGGLIHLLLPEPVSASESDQPAKYAVTGMPLFLRELYAQGARPQQLKAIVAGGVLVGPVNELDLALDIGGRTTDTVKRILVDEGIQIEKSETGGFSAFHLHLNLQQWQSSIEPVGLERIAGQPSPHLPEPSDIQTAIEKLLPIPQVALKILRLIEANDYDIAEIGREVRRDQVISAKTLRLCNCAMYARLNRIDTPEDALILLGRDLFLQLVIACAVKNFFSPPSTGYSLCQGGLFHHAVGTALIAEKLARYTGASEPTRAYTAGLLHDIGKVVLDQFIAGAFPLFYRGLQQDQNILEVERQMLQQDHTQAGLQLAQLWSFPDALTDVIEHHHQPEKACCDPSLTHIVYLANLLMTRFHSDLELIYPETGQLAPRLETIGLSPQQLPEIVDAIPQHVFVLPTELVGD